MRKQEQETENYFYIKTYYRLTDNLCFGNANGCYLAGVPISQVVTETYQVIFIFTL